jgi:hypothetical protein
MARIKARLKATNHQNRLRWPGSSGLGGRRSESDHGGTPTGFSLVQIESNAARPSRFAVGATAAGGAAGAIPRALLPKIGFTN